jgi:hypothetical protein
MELGSYGLGSNPLILLFPVLESAEDLQASGRWQQHSCPEQSERRRKMDGRVRGRPTCLDINL